ncbi:interleukin-10 receptor subunit beta [Trachinotus anak]|uniref:interleukin-10 receptor subunit beta n=1 Tax=Trachinotus anak TaxID=443729 RepID=UPI0039F2284D
MSAAVNICLLLWSLQNIVGLDGFIVTTSVPAELPPPHHLTMITLNTNYTLTWSWDQTEGESRHVNFTTQYVGKFELKYKKKTPNWSTVCEQTSLRSCDLTVLDLHHLGTYMLRVRATVNRRHSEWVQLEFFPDQDAALGPPAHVDLAPAGSDLDVFISDPLTSTDGSLKDLLGDVYYHIMYWERSTVPQTSRTQTLNSTANVVTLPHLKAWTWYCVSVQSCRDFYKKRSSFTSPQCLQTEGNSPWWQIFLYFLGSLVVCFLVMLFLLYSPFWCYKTLKATLYPSNQLPSHFTEYLYGSPGSDIPRLLSPDSQSEQLCDKVTVCPEPAVLEVHSPPEAPQQPAAGLEPDSSGRHSRQDSSSSGDSGVYSSGGSSNLQPHSNQAPTGGPDFWQGPFDLEQLKMQEMSPGLKTHLLSADDSIVDMCV